MKVDVENLIAIIEESYPPIDRSDCWKDLLKLIPKDGQASPGRSEVNEKLRRIWGENDRGETISDEDLKYISDYYDQQSRFWKSKLTPESQWPTEGIKLMKFFAEYPNIDQSMTFPEAQHKAIQWLQTSGVREGFTLEDMKAAFNNIYPYQLSFEEWWTEYKAKKLLSKTI